MRTPKQEYKHQWYLKHKSKKYYITKNGVTFLNVQNWGYTHYFKVDDNGVTGKFHKLEELGTLVFE
jgi:hypothetical protein